MGEEADDDTTPDLDPPARRESVSPWEAKFREERRRHKLANDRISSLESELTDLRPKAQTAEGITARMKDLEAKHATERDRWTVERAAFGAGITDPEGIDVAVMLHGRLPKEGRPTIDAWLTGLKADPTKIPRPLQSYLTPPDDGEETGEEEAEEPPARKAATPPRGPNAGVKGKQSAAGGGGKPTPAAIQAAFRKAQMGDVADYNAILAAQGIPPLPKAR
jgi:hypothetical protein